MQKYRKSDIQTFEFNDLQSTHVITQTRLEDFSFKELNGEVFNKEKISDEKMRLERNHEQKSSFKIDAKVRESRGLFNQEQSDLEKTIQQEVQRRMEAVYQKAVAEGFEKGRQEAHEQALQEYQEALALKINEMEEVIASIKTQADVVLQDNRQEVYEFIKRFTKWIVFKEINEKLYLEQLLEKLILELNARKNIIIKVGRANFAEMPQVIQTVEARLGQLVNVRVEIKPELKYPGIILESENGLIDGSLEQVFQNIDKIFQQVTQHE